MATKSGLDPRTDPNVKRAVFRGQPYHYVGQSWTNEVTLEAMFNTGCVIHVPKDDIDLELDPSQTSWDLAWQFVDARQEVMKHLVVIERYIQHWLIKPEAREANEYLGHLRAAITSFPRHDR